MTGPRSSAAHQAATDALDKALEDHRAGCFDDARFTADEIPAAELVPICRACPVRVACRTYAETCRPRSGFWAGRERGRKPARGGDA